MKCYIGIGIPAIPGQWNAVGVFMGDLFGPAGATDNALARFDGATGKLVQNSVAILDDTGNLTGLASIQADTTALTTTSVVKARVRNTTDAVVGAQTQVGPAYGSLGHAWAIAGAVDADIEGGWYTHVVPANAPFGRIRFFDTIDGGAQRLIAEITHGRDGADVVGHYALRLGTARLQVAGSDGTNLYFAGSTVANTYFNASTSTNLQSNGVTRIVCAAGGVQLGAAADFGTGTGVVGIDDCSVIPSTNPTAGGVLYSEGGALKWRGSAGTVTPLAPA